MATFGPHRYQYELGKRNYNLSAVIPKWVKKNQELLDVIVKSSVQDLIDEAQLSDDKGGKMRVDTGFLRASGKLSFTGLPTGPVRGDDDKKYEYDPNVVLTVLNEYKSGQTIFFGWTANYAKFREAYDGFLYSAVQNWQAIVKKNVAKLRKDLGG